MSSPYDTYNYSDYWKERAYEHNSERLAIHKFLKRIPKIKATLEIGGGYGRLVPSYAFRAKRVVLSDPSQKLLNEAKKKLKTTPNIEYLKSTLENLPKRLNTRKFDLIIMVRVLHHLKDIDKALSTIKKLSTQDGYLILEFANKLHFKAVLKNALKGNFKYINEMEPIDRRSMKNIKAIPFRNYHPKMIIDKLNENGFKIVEILSVSNARSPWLKRHIPITLLAKIEKITQKPLAKVFFGPSIFILSRRS